MNTMLAVTALAARSTRSPLARTFLATLGVIALLGASPREASAQAEPARSGRWELTFLSGGVVPTGSHRRLVSSGALSAVQLSRVVRPSLALSATAGWAKSRDLASALEPRLDRVRYDAGAELRGSRRALGAAFSLAPFATAGAGGRSDVRRHDAGAAKHAMAAYAGVGGEIGFRRARLRVEVRDELSTRRPLGGLRADAARNDVAIMAGLRWVSR